MGLPDFVLQGCQIFKFHYNSHTRPHRKLKIGTVQFCGTRNRLVTFSKRSDQQGCQISHCRVARYSNFTIIHILRVFANIFVACDEVHHNQLMRLLYHKIVFCSRILVDHKTPVLKSRPGPRDKLG